MRTGMGLFVNWDVYVLKACLGFIVGHLLYEVFFTLTLYEFTIKDQAIVRRCNLEPSHLLG